MQDNQPAVLKLWERLDHLIAIFEAGVLIFALAGMTLMIFAQVIMRNFFSTGVLWFDPAARHLLLVPVYVGASLATRHKHHLHMDALTKLFKGKNRQRLDIFLNLFAAAVCAVVFLGAWQFLKTTYESGEKIESHFPAWIAQIVMPYGFGMMTLRFIKEACHHAYRLAKGLPPESEPVPHGLVIPGTEEIKEI